MSTVVIAMEED